MANNTERVKYMIYTVPETNIKFNVRQDYETDMIVIREIWEENVYEVSDWRYNNGGVVVDLGANIGSFSIYSANKGATVYSVEPEPNNLKELKENVSLNNFNDLITIVPYGISNYDGSAIITDMGGGATIKDDALLGSKIQITTLDNLFNMYNISEVDILKIDVEGSETEIISGASKENLNKCKYITMEFDIRSGPFMGNMVKKLSETHHVRTMGSWERGGMIWAWLY
jgi:FkbM family methyltransferase